MEWLLFVVAVLFTLLGAGCLVLIVFGLPGTWVMLAGAAIIEFADRLYLPADDRQTFAWWLLGVCLGLALVGELLEFLAGVVGAKYGGGTRRGMIGAIVGGILGVFVFTPFLFFIPVVGSLVGALIGTFIGAYVGELSAEGASKRGSVRPATGATIGRVLGTMGKMGTAVVVWVALSASAFLP